MIHYGVKQICTSAFEGCRTLETVILPNTIVNIGDRAFKNCESLIFVAFSDNICNIANSMFEGCVSLATVQLPKCVLSIGRSAFRGCESLELNELPNVKTIDIFAFAGCKSLKRIILRNVVSIGDEAFVNCGSLTVEVTDNPLLSNCGQIFGENNESNAVLDIHADINVPDVVLAKRIAEIPTIYVKEGKEWDKPLFLYKDGEVSMIKDASSEAVQGYDRIYSKYQEAYNSAIKCSDTDSSNMIEIDNEIKEEDEVINNETSGFNNKSDIENLRGCLSNPSYSEEQTRMLLQFASQYLAEKQNLYFLFVSNNNEKPVVNNNKLKKIKIANRKGKSFLYFLKCFYGGKIQNGKIEIVKDISNWCLINETIEGLNITTHNFTDNLVDETKSFFLGVLGEKTN